MFTVTKLFRLARSVGNMLEIVAGLEAKGATLRILNLGLDTANPTGKLMLTVMGDVAEFERVHSLKAKGKSVRAIAEGLDAKGLTMPRGGPWEAVQIQIAAALVAG